MPALAYVKDDNDVLHWSASVGPVLVVGVGIWYWCGTGIYVLVFGAGIYYLHFSD